jgi:hypothetical protein
LRFALFFCPFFVHVTAYDFWVNIKESASYILCVGEIGVPASFQIIIEYSADSAGFTPMGKEEILIAPFFKFRVIGRIMAVAALFKGGVEILRVLFNRENGG